MKTLVEIGLQWHNAKFDILAENHSGIYAIKNEPMYIKFIRELDNCSRMVVEELDLDYQNANALAITYKMTKQLVLNEPDKVGIWEGMKYWTISNPEFFLNITNVQDAETMDSIEEVLVNAPSGILTPKSSILRL